MRDSGGPPRRVLVSESGDDGLTWTPAIDSEIPNPGSSLEVVATREGYWLMVYNDSEQGRHSLAAALSDDEGNTWKWHKKIAAASDKSYAYPSLIQSSDGNFQLTYSYKENGKACIQHTVFNIRWLKGE
jgi:predicted neuraminidase